MSYANQRSLTEEVNEGLTDGSYKKIVRDRGGVVEATTHDARRDLADVWYGIHEAQTKARPDGHAVNTPNFVPTPAPHLYLGM